MGDIIKTFPVRSTTGEKSRLLKFYFDTGSPRTFVKQSATRGMKGLARLPEPEAFRGLGNGPFNATSIVRIRIELLGIWVPHLCYVLPDNVLGSNYDILLGHDFMQIYDIQINPKQRGILIRKESLRMALQVRATTKPNFQILR